MKTPTEQDGREALRDHAVRKALEARAAHGPCLDRPSVERLLDDRAVVRYPVGLRFDAEALEPGEFAFPHPLGERPSEGYCLFIHPRFESRPETWALLAAYHIPTINYGDVVDEETSECFGAALVGMERESYYQALCALADEIAEPG